MKHASIICYLVAVILCFSFIQSSFAQEEEKEHAKKEKTKVSFRDSLDHQFDLSDWLINKNGFIPVPAIITEPAFGGFGGALAPVFIHQNAPVIRNDKVYPMAPNVAVVAGGYTLNNTWGVGGGYAGTIRKWGVRYSLMGGYGNVNIDYYFDIEKLNKKDVNVEFNIRTIPISASISKQFKDPRFSLGLEYLYMHNELKVNNIYHTDYEVINEIIDDIGDYISDYVSGDIAKLGLKASFDGRDNTFTPNKGLKTYITADWSNPVVGSDAKFGQFEGAAYYYIPILHNLITGLRFDMQQIVGDIPFYLKPYIDMRGVPSARYQGNTTMLLELEERWDFVRRWSLVAFGGGGKGFDDFSKFKDADWAWSYGGGFRYLIARKLNLRMGVDVAMGPEGFTYYMIFGSSWLRQ